MSKQPIPFLPTQSHLFLPHDNIAYSVCLLTVMWGADLASPSGFLAELNDSFGGELWMDGMLCYEEGLKVKDPFEDELEWGTEEESLEITGAF